ncbi:MAG TPA: UTP--glucose-1-phosphate uridylyltransferase [Ruminococcaceae bacterium]|nr:UTP--glucose-1-phosphate uridylyltransferase [Oscillospiraceae bacterium]
MKVRKAVILAAGFGTRVLPATKSMPKEMLTIVDKPAIQYIVEEVSRAGIEDILIVLSRGKNIVEDHFDRSPDLERQLEKSGKTDILEAVKKISGLAKIQFVRQQEMKGTGDAVMTAKAFIGSEPFAVLYGDDVIIGEDPAVAQVCRVFEETGKGTVAMKEVSDELVMKYSSMKTNHLHNNIYGISDMIEKPKPEEIFSNFAILGRCVLPPKIFEILEKLPAGAGGEYQLTDAMKELARTEGMIGVDFTGTRYDMGNKLGILKAIVEVGLEHPEVKEGFREYLKEICSTRL